MSADTTHSLVTEHDLLTVLKFLAGGRDIEFAAQASQLTEAQVAQIADDNGFPDLAMLRWAADLQQKTIDKGRSTAATVAPRPVGQRVTPPNPTRAPAPRPAPPAARLAAPPIQSAAAAAKPAADTPQADPIAALVGELIGQGLRSDKARTRAVAQKILDIATDLQERLHADDVDQAQVEAALKARAAADAEVRTLEKKLAAAKAKRDAIGSKKKRVSTANTAALEARHAYQKQTLAIYGVTVDDIRRWAALNGHKVGDVGMLPRAVLDAYAHEQEAEARSTS